MVLYSPMTLLSEIILLSAVGDDGVGGGGSAADNGIPSKCVMERLRFPLKGRNMSEDRVGRWFCKGSLIRMPWRLRNGVNERNVRRAMRALFPCTLISGILIIEK